jgi:hypothetical protein
MKTSYTTHGLLFESKDVAIIVSNHFVPIEVEIYDSAFTIKGEIYIAPDFNKHNEIECNIILSNSRIDLEDVRDNASAFFISVTMSENEDPVLHVEGRNFKLEHLSMELQERIHKVANEMCIDWLKVKED